MKHLKLLLLFSLFYTGVSSQTYKQIGNTFQERIIGADTSTRLNAGATGFRYIPSVQQVKDLIAQGGTGGAYTAGYGIALIDKEIKVDTVAIAVKTKTINLHEGDSITDTNPETGGFVTNYPNILDTISTFFKKNTKINVAKAGETVSQYLSENQYQTQIYPHRPLKKLDVTNLWLRFGINDLVIHTPEQVYQDLKTAWAEAKEDGFTVYAFTITPIGLEPYNSYATILNQYIRSDKSLYYKLVDIGRAFENINPKDPNYYYPDEVHPAYKGSYIIAKEILNSINNTSYGDVLSASVKKLDDGYLLSNSISGNARFWGTKEASFQNYGSGNIAWMVGQNMEGLITAWQPSQVQGFVGINDGSVLSNSISGNARFWGGKQANFTSFGAGSISWLVGQNSEGVATAWQSPSVRSFLDIGLQEVLNVRNFADSSIYMRNNRQILFGNTNGERVWGISADPINDDFKIETSQNIHLSVSRFSGNVKIKNLSGSGDAPVFVDFNGILKRGSSSSDPTKANLSGGNTFTGVNIFQGGTIQPLSGFTNGGTSTFNTLQSNAHITNVNTFLPPNGGQLINSVSSLNSDIFVSGFDYAPELRLNSSTVGGANLIPKRDGNGTLNNTVTGSNVATNFVSVTGVGVLANSTSGIAVSSVSTSGKAGRFETSSGTGVAVDIVNTGTGDFLSAINSSGLKLSIKNSGGIQASDDIEVTDFNKGVILRASDGSRWRITVSTTGVLTSTLTP